MAQTEIKAEDLLAEISALLDKHRSALTDMHSGPITKIDEQLTHGVFTRLTNIAAMINMDALKSKPDFLTKAGAIARTSLGFVANHLASNLADLKKEDALIDSVFDVDETALVVGAVRIIRSPHEVPEFVDAVRNVSPVASLCIGTSEILHKVIAYTKQQLEKEGAQADSKKTRVLYAEDYEEIRTDTAEKLREAGFEVVAVENGQLALEELQRAKAAGEKFDVLVTDGGMPRMKGMELLKTEEAREVPVRILNTADLISQEDVSEQVPGVALVSKPSKIEALTDCIQRGLSTAQAGKAAGHLIEEAQVQRQEIEGEFRPR